MIDFNCPYSYIGLERIKKATEKLDLDVEWEMKSFELYTEAGKRPQMTTSETFQNRYSISQDEATKKIEEIEKTALEEGLNINFRNFTLTSSKDGLRLAKFAQNMHPDLTLNLVFEIFASNMVENENIADVNVLKRIAVSCGINESEAEKILDNNYYNIECFLDMEDALSNGITATPCFILEKNEDRLIIPGVFSGEEFEIALKDFESGKINDKTFV